ncbi:MAG TPA: preprotein translocase subunit SecE [Firmicutes bacterium]|nr:preprotein translocase subunit SecE [Bacillota bacterium]
MGVATKSESKPITQRIGRFLREVRAELKKVVWPDREELKRYTLLVIASVAVIAVCVGLVDFAFGRLLFLLQRLGG